jgi:hypothetical protein
MWVGRFAVAGNTRPKVGSVELAGGYGIDGQHHLGEEIGFAGARIRANSAAAEFSKLSARLSLAGTVSPVQRRAQTPAVPVAMSPRSHSTSFYVRGRSRLSESGAPGV